MLGNYTGNFEIVNALQGIMGKKSSKNKSNSKLVIGWVIWIFVALLIISVIRNLGKIVMIRKDIEAEKAKVEKMKEDNAQLQDQILEAQSPDFIEQQIRDKLGLVKPGETIVVLPDADTLRKLAPQIESTPQVLPDPNWKKWENLFL